MFCRSMDPLVGEAMITQVSADDAQDATSSPVASPLDGGMLHPADDQVSCYHESAGACVSRGSVCHVSVMLLPRSDGRGCMVLPADACWVCTTCKHSCKHGRLWRGWRSWRGSRSGTQPCSCASGCGRPCARRRCRRSSPSGQVLRHRHGFSSPTMQLLTWLRAPSDRFCTCLAVTAGVPRCSFCHLLFANA